MKQFINLLISVCVCICCFACNENPSPEVAEAKEVIEDDVVVKRPISNELTDAQLKDIETIHATFSEVYPVSLNESIKNFKGDQDPQREIEIWMTMVETFNSFVESGKYARIEEKQEVFSVILASTMMSLEKIQKDVELTELEESEVQQIHTTLMANFSED